MNNVSYEEARARCVRHYMNRGYSEKHAEDHIPHDEERVFYIYNIVQEQEERGKDHGRSDVLLGLAAAAEGGV